MCTLVAGQTLHVAWLGDSQAILVQQGQVVKLMEPHRPERQVWKGLPPLQDVDGWGPSSRHWGESGSGALLVPATLT